MGKLLKREYRYPVCFAKEFRWWEIFGQRLLWGTPPGSGRRARMRPSSSGASGCLLCRTINESPSMEKQIQATAPVVEPRRLSRYPAGSALPRGAFVPASRDGRGWLASSCAPALPAPRAVTSAPTVIGRECAATTPAPNGLITRPKRVLVDPVIYAHVHANGMVGTWNVATSLPECVDGVSPTPPASWPCRAGHRCPSFPLPLLPRPLAVAVACPGLRAVHPC